MSFFNGFCHLSHLNKSHQKWFPVIQIRQVNILSGFIRVTMDSCGPTKCGEVPITTIESTLQKHTNPPRLLTRESAVVSGNRSSGSNFFFYPPSPQKQILHGWADTTENYDIPVCAHEESLENADLLRNIFKYPRKEAFKPMLRFMAKQRLRPTGRENRGLQPRPR